MNSRLIRSLLVLFLVGLLLAACRRATPTGPAPTEPGPGPSPTAPLQATTVPEDTYPEPGGESYPGVENPQQYPQPEESNSPTASPDTGPAATPTPGIDATATATATLPPTDSGAYPGPGTGYEAGSEGDPYPGSGEGQQGSTQAVTPTVTPAITPTVTPPAQGGGTGEPPSRATGTPTATGTAQSPAGQATGTPQPTATAPFLPTQQATKIPLNARMRATDPATVKLAAGKVQLVEFFAFWCGACKFMAPIMHDLDARYNSRMNFIYLDIDDPATANLKKSLGFRTEPHFFLLDAQGKILKQWQGQVTSEELEAAIQAALK